MITSLQGYVISHQYLAHCWNLITTSRNVTLQAPRGLRDSTPILVTVLEPHCHAMSQCWHLRVTSFLVTLLQTSSHLRHTTSLEPIALSQVTM